MLVAVLTAASAPLDLELTCPGQYEDVETSVGQTSRYVDGKWQRGTTTINRRVTVPGTAKLSLHGAVGDLTYPDGRKRALTNVVADDRTITAEYVRKPLLFTITWRVEINRMTGEVRVASGGDVGFQGSCSVVPTQQKF